MLERILDQQIQSDYEALQTTHREWDTTKFRVSDAGRCRLMRYWKRQGKERPELPPNVLRIFALGYLFQEWIETAIKKQGWDLMVEIEVEDEERRGHIDALIHVDDGIILYDWKTVNGKKFWYLKQYGDRNSHYHYQVATYAQMFEQPLLDARIADINKDDLSVYETSVHLVEMQHKAAEDWKILLDAWKNQQEPQANPEPWECRYCVYNSDCSQQISS